MLKYWLDVWDFYYHFVDSLSESDWEEYSYNRNLSSLYIIEKRGWDESGY